MPAKSSSTPSNAPRCQHRTAAGRQCRSLADDHSSGLCPHHAAQVSVRDADFREALTQHSSNFQRAQGINNSLGVLYRLLAEGRISPRRASVLANISSLLLRTLPAIDYDEKRFGDDDAEAQDSDEQSQEHDQAEDNDEAGEEQIPHEAIPSRAAQPIPPGKEPLPATAGEFADAVLNSKSG